MAIKLEDKQNVVAPNSTYPYGNIKDNPGNNTGTPLNALVHADFHQFFAKMLAESGVVANGLVDNADNGFQYYQALVAVINYLAGIIVQTIKLTFSLASEQLISSITYADIPTTSVTLTTPDDGITRTYLVLVTGYAQSSDNDAVTNSILELKVVGNTLGDIISEHRIGWNKSSSSEQRSDYYNISMHTLISIPANETVKVQAKREATLFTLKKCNLSLLEFK